MTPPPRVSAKNYPGENRAAKVRIRIKGEPDGPVYQGQEIIQPCDGCAEKSRLQRPVKTDISTS